MRCLKVDRASAQSAMFKVVRITVLLGIALKFSLRLYARSQLYQDAEDLKHLIDALRKVGLK